MLAPIAGRPAPAGPDRSAVTRDATPSASTPPRGLPTGDGGTPSTAPTALPNRPGPNNRPNQPDPHLRLRQAVPSDLGFWRPGRLDQLHLRPGRQPPDPRSQGTQISYAYDHADRITSAGATSYTIDAIGNVTVRGPDTLSYDQANRLTSIDFSAAPPIQLRLRRRRQARQQDGRLHDHQLRLRRQSWPAGRARGWRPRATSGASAWRTRSRAAPALVYHVDGLGSVRAITDSHQSRRPDLRVGRVRRPNRHVRRLDPAVRLHRRAARP